MASIKLTDHLLAHINPIYASATQHTFLTQAGNGTLPLSRLALWLSQDRIYAAHAYPRFIGSLISQIPFRDSDDISGPKERQNEVILQILVKCLDNIVSEVEFFRKAAKEWDMDLDAWLQRKGTRDYTAEMARISSSGTLQEGLVFLWGMEKVYLDAWTYVKELHSILPSDKALDNVSVGAVSKFATNWSSLDFQAFVQALEDLVNGFGIILDTDEWRRAEEIWERVIELEVGFWPNNGEETTMQKSQS